MEERCKMKVSKIEGRCNICGIRLRKSRRKRGMSQDRMSLELQRMGLDITQKGISRIETGKRVIADYELKYLADVLNVSVCEILGIEEKVQSENQRPHETVYEAGNSLK